MKTYDLAIIGLGAMGSAGLYHANQHGLDVIGFDQFEPPHTFGSSHGQTRVIREAYFEDPAYVPLLQSAYAHWQDLQNQWHEPILQLTGGLMIGPPQSELVQGCLRSAREHNLNHAFLKPSELAQQHAVFQLPADFVAVAEPRAGFVYSENAIRAHLHLASQNGARVSTSDLVQSWRKTNDGFEILAASGSYFARRLAVCSGAWMPAMQNKFPLKVTRQVLFWFKTLQPEQFTPDHFGVFLLELAKDHYLYGFPDIGEGFKVAIHATGRPIDPDTLSKQSVTKAEIAEMCDYLQTYLPTANGELSKSAVCLYTNAPDGHFVIDTDPETPDLLWVSPCSGHGYKFAATVGEIVATWAQGKDQSYDLSLFSYGRFTS